MPRNRVQHQKGLSDDAFEQRYPDEEACRKAWFAWRWPEGFKCPRCAASEYCEISERQLLQCRRCRYQTSLIAGTILQGTKLPMRVWFRAMHLLAQGKKGLSNIELGRRLGISTNAAWRVQHKLMQAMIERDRRYKLGAAGPRIEIDDAYIGGERTGEGAGRGRRGHTVIMQSRVRTSRTTERRLVGLYVTRGNRGWLTSTAVAVIGVPSRRTSGTTLGCRFAPPAHLCRGRLYRHTFRGFPSRRTLSEAQASPNAPAPPTLRRRRRWRVPGSARRRGGASTARS